MTNILAMVAVAIVTNVVEVDNSSGCRICSQSGSIGCVPAVYHSGGFVPCAPYVPPTEKTETTTVVEVKTIKFTWEGKEYTGKSERVLSEKVRRWKLKENWVEESEGKP